MAGPLDGIRVVEMGTMIAVPGATELLATQGAAVVKVEDTAGGDVLRHYGSKKNGMSGWFCNANAGKRSIGLDLAQPDGVAIMLRLLDQADVFVQGFRPGVVDRLGIGADVVRDRNPALIYVSSAGFGLDGPEANRPVYDPVIQALSGWAGAQTDRDGAPTLIRGFVADKVAALTTAQAVTAALVSRGRTGQGQHIEVSMLEANVAFNWPDVMMHATVLDDDAEHLPNLLGSYQLFPSSDGWVTVTAGTDSQWQAVCRALDRPELGTDERFATSSARNADMAGWYRVFGEMCRAFPTEEVLRRCRDADVPAVPVLAPAEVADQPQLVARNAIGVVEHPVVGRLRTARPGARFSEDGTPPDLSPAPTHGQHTDEILADLGHDAATIAALRERLVVR